MLAALSAPLATVDPVTTITGSVGDLSGQLLTVGGAAIAISGTLLVLRKGWGFFSKLIKA